MNVAVIFQTHKFSREISAEYRKLEKACQGIGEAWLLYQGNGTNDLFGRPDVRVHRCTFNEIKNLGYPINSLHLIPGHTHYPLAHFYANHPGYSYYWLIEYDVRFSGSWETLLNAFAGIPADFIAAHFAIHAQEPNWKHWDLSHPDYYIPLEERWRCFHPIYRISNAALAFVCDSHRQGWRGHSEVIYATLLGKNNFSLVDFGGKGAFVLPNSENRFYTAREPNLAGELNSGTLRWRPMQSWLRLRRNKIYHPVKTYL